MNDSFIIPLNGMKDGREKFSWQVDERFFNDFGNDDIRRADIGIDAEVHKSGSCVGVDVRLEGHVTVPCDRCLDDLELPVGRDVRLSVKFGEDPASLDEDFSKDERETVYVSSERAELDLGQIIYDYVCLEIPLQRIHPEGECDSEMLGWISSGKPSDGLSGEVRESETEVGGSPFEALRGLFDKAN